MRLFSSVLLSVILIIFGSGLAWAKGDAPVAPKILILNSYHQGYQWSDDEVNGIESVLYRQFPQADIQVEYMDTKRNFSASRLDELAILYERKYSGKQYDLIVSTDDNAFQFLKRFRHTVFGDVPLVFCGLNQFQPEMLAGMRNLTGVVENFSMADTLQIIARLHPDLKKLVVITDVTPSSLLMTQQFKAALNRLPQRIPTEILNGLPITELEKRLSRLSPNSAVFMLNYFRDKEGTYYKSETTMQRLSQASKVPIYGLNDFYMNHGLTGGVVNEAYAQGSMAGELAVRVLKGVSPDRIAVRTEYKGRPVFDHRLMKRFKLNVSNLPADADLVHVKHGSQKNILILHSYHPGYQWTSSLSQGLSQGLANRRDIGEIFEEYLDAKRLSNPAYFHLLYELYRKKYAHRAIDLVIVTDDPAFTFTQKFRNLLFNNVPIVFCGVNHIENPQAINKKGVTGVLQLSDIAGSLNAMLHIYPETEKVLVINDHTPTGQQYRLRLNMLRRQLDKPVALEFTGNLSMEQIRKKVSGLDDKTGVFFMTLIRDGNNQRYQLKESARMLSQASSRPIFGLIESHLKNGIAGGSIIYGSDHGRKAAKLASGILDGKRAEDTPIVNENAFRLIFSYPVLQRYQVSTDRLPPNSTLIDAPSGIYYQHKWKIIITFCTLSLLVILVAVQQYRVRQQKKGKLKAEIEARIDDMTGTINRNYFEREVELLLEKCREKNQKMTLCFADINQLKYVNDIYGHHMGDDYIVAMVDLLRSAIRSSDRIYRMGGDEFVIVFEDCDTNHARERIKTMRDELTRLNDQRSAPYLRGMSFGLATFDPQTPREFQQLLEEADHQMYLDKKAGKGEGVHM